MRAYTFKLLLVIAAAAAALAIAACGNDSEKSSSPLDNGLSYLPKSTPFAVSIGTDLDGDQAQAVSTIADKFPFGSQVKSQVQRKIEDQAGDFDRLRKLLGNDFVVGSTDARNFAVATSGEDRSFVGAIEAKDEDALNDLLKDQKVKETGEQDGAKLYTDESGDPFAIDDGTLVVAGSERELVAALKRHDGDDSFSEDDFDAGTKGVSKGGLLRAYFDVQGLLAADPSAKTARQVKWVAALRGLGISAKATGDSVGIDFDLQTDPKGLSEKDLPIATATSAPGVLDRRGEIGLGLVDPAQLYDFAIAAARQTGNSATVDQGIEQIQKELGISLDEDLFGQLGTAEASVALDGKFGIRADLEDKATFKRSLDKIASRLKSLSPDAKVARSGPFTAVSTGGQTYVFGVVAGKLVFANDARLAGTVAADQDVAVPGAKGALAMKADGEALGSALIAQMGGRLGLGGQLGSRLITGPLGELTGSVESSTKGLKGRVELGFD